MSNSIKQIAQYFLTEEYELGRQLAKGQNISIGDIAEYILDSVGISTKFKESDYISSKAKGLRSGWGIYLDKNTLFHARYTLSKNSSIIFNTYLTVYYSHEHSIFYDNYQFTFIFAIADRIIDKLQYGVGCSFTIEFTESETISAKKFSGIYSRFIKRFLKGFVKHLKTYQND